MVFMANEIVTRTVLPEIRGRNAFEFGCGTGRNLAALQRGAARTVAGCDLSPGMLSVARRRPELSNAGLFLHDMTQPLPIADASVDFVLFCLTLEHLQDFRFPLREARRILRPEGRIAIIEIHPFLSQSGVAAHFDDPEGFEVRMPAFAHKFADYLNAFAEIGLRVAVCGEWRPADVGTPPPLAGMSRGPEFPLTLQLLCDVGER